MLVQEGDCPGILRQVEQLLDIERTSDGPAEQTGAS
jgi:hypothetical protein